MEDDIGTDNDGGHHAAPPCHKGKMETNYVKFPDIHILNYVGNGVTGIVTIISSREML